MNRNNKMDNNADNNNLGDYIANTNPDNGDANGSNCLDDVFKLNNRQRQKVGLGLGFK